jgi:hypothetical protein
MDKYNLPKYTTFKLKDSYKVYKLLEYIENKTKIKYFQVGNENQIFSSWQ